MLIVDSDLHENLIQASGAKEVMILRMAERQKEFIRHFTTFMLLTLKFIESLEMCG